jgi:predicted SAM-dependent methyltransferase
MSESQSGLPYGRNLGFRDHIRRDLIGNGLDLGPWHEPFVTPNGKVKTVERYSLTELKINFSELPEDEFTKLKEPDFVCDFDKDFLNQFDSASLDFVIASHLLEHIAQPFLLISDAYRILKPGGILLLAIPDLRNTFDFQRKSLGVNHFIKDIEDKITINEFSHFSDYASNVLKINPTMMSPEKIQKIIIESYHVHAFVDHEFVKILNEMQGLLDFHFELIFASQSIEKDARYEEFILFLKKTKQSTNLHTSFHRLTKTNGLVKLNLMYRLKNLIKSLFLRGVSS